MITSHIESCVDTRSNFIITGILKNGKRFTPIFTKEPQHYNIWKGTIWLISGGTRFLIKRINW